MNLTTSMQESILALLCYDEKYGKIVQGLVPWQMFDPYYRDIAREAGSSWVRWKKPAGEHTLDYIDKLVEKSPDSKRQYTAIYQSLQVTRHEINPEFVLDTVRVFARRQQLKSGVAEILDALEKETAEGVQAAEAAMARTLKASVVHFDSGIDFNNPDREFGFLNQERMAAVPTGIKEFDALQLGPKKGRLHMFCGGAKAGKTWWLGNLMKRAMMHRWSSLYMSFEVDKDVMDLRMIQTVFAVTKRKADDLVGHVFEHDKEGSITGFADVELGSPLASTDPDFEPKIRRKLKRMKNRARMRIVQFAPRSIDVRGLDAYLDSFEAANGWLPSLLLVDYADKLKVDTKNLRVALGAMTEELRGVAVTRKIAIATASQLNRTGSFAKQADERHIAEDFSKVAVADDIFIYSRTPSEKEYGTARIRAVSREDESGFDVMVTQNYATGQFVTSSGRMNKNYWKLIDTDGDEEEHDEDDTDEQ